LAVGQRDEEKIIGRKSLEQEERRRNDE